MRKPFPLAPVFAALAVCGALSACQAPNSASTISDIQTAIAVGCPVVATIQSSAIKLTTAQRTALNTLALVCPPNPAPTAATVVLADVIQAYATLAPLVSK